jgi:UDP-2,3-diacylglucosamine pyrophosphatase LpxH
MIKSGILYFLFLCAAVNLQAQSADSVYSRVIFIGDAGKIDKGQKAVVKHASAQVLKNRTNVVFLGDNIYPQGMGLPGSKEEEETKEILKSQFVPLRKQGAPVYFIPGNHDWDHSGKQGLAKIKRQSDYLKEQGDKLLKMVPPDGCPDPLALEIHEKLTIIVYDSEWWLFPYVKNDPSGNCLCKTEQQVLDRLKQLASKNKEKIILVASHHPFKTYGEHGGYKKIPVIGGLFRFFKTKFPGREDTGHPVYQQMIRKISGIFKAVPNVVYVAGHDHGLQYIAGEKVQVVSGAGAKKSDLHKGDKSLFAEAKAGYVVTDLLSQGRLKVTFFAETVTGMREVFTKIIYTHASHKART